MAMKDYLPDPQGKGRPRKAPVPFTDAIILLLANNISNHYATYSEVTVLGAVRHSKINQVQEMIMLISGTKNLTIWIYMCTQTVPDGQQEAEQENKDGNDKDTGAHGMMISNHLTRASNASNES